MSVFVCVENDANEKGAGTCFVQTVSRLSGLNGWSTCKADANGKIISINMCDSSLTVCTHLFVFLLVCLSFCNLCKSKMF